MMRIICVICILCALCGCQAALTGLPAGETAAVSVATAPTDVCFGVVAHENMLVNALKQGQPAALPASP